MFHEVRDYLEERINLLHRERDEKIRNEPMNHFEVAHVISEYETRIDEINKTLELMQNIWERDE